MNGFYVDDGDSKKVVMMMMMVVRRRGGCTLNGSYWREVDPLENGRRGTQRFVALLHSVKYTSTSYLEIQEPYTQTVA